MNTSPPLQPLAVECRCYRCHSGYVGQVLFCVLAVVLLVGFVVVVLS